VEAVVTIDGRGKRQEGVCLGLLEHERSIKVGKEQRRQEKKMYTFGIKKPYQRPQVLDRIWVSWGEVEKVPMFENRGFGPEKGMGGKSSVH